MFMLVCVCIQVRAFVPVRMLCIYVVYVCIMYYVLMHFFWICFVNECFICILYV